MLTATGERDIEHLGGLFHRMPATALAFLVGCVAISALPPLNGFVSEWLMFQAILLSPHLPQWGLKTAVPAVGRPAGAGRGAGGRLFRPGLRRRLPRPAALAAAASRREEVDRFSLAAMAALAVLCLLAGVLPGLIIDALAPVVCGGRRRPHAAAAKIAWLSIAPIAASRSSYNGLLVFLFIVIRARWRRRRSTASPRRRAPRAGLGLRLSRSGPATQYSAASFAQPIRRVFGGFVFAARETVDMPPPGEMRAGALIVTLHDPSGRRSTCRCEGRRAARRGSTRCSS